MNSDLCGVSYPRMHIRVTLGAVADMFQGWTAEATKDTGPLGVNWL